jgi:hypothetical protein
MMICIIKKINFKKYLSRNLQTLNLTFGICIVHHYVKIQLKGIKENLLLPSNSLNTSKMLKIRKIYHGQPSNSKPRKMTNLRNVWYKVHKIAKNQKDKNYKTLQMKI